MKQRFQVNKSKAVTYFTCLFLLFISGCSKRNGAFCSDGSYSNATGSGACSWHGGVSSWDSDFSGFGFFIFIIVIYFLIKASVSKK